MTRTANSNLRIDALLRIGEAGPWLVRLALSFDTPLLKELEIDPFVIEGQPSIDYESFQETVFYVFAHASSCQLQDDAILIRF